jgi:hypothetical protein
LDDGVDRYLGINGATRASSLETFVATFSANQYERPIADSAGEVHPRVVEYCEESDAFEYELSRVVNGVATRS